MGLTLAGSANHITAACVFLSSFPFLAAWGDGGEKWRRGLRLSVVAGVFYVLHTYALVVDVLLLLLLLLLLFSG